MADGPHGERDEEDGVPDEQAEDKQAGYQISHNAESSPIQDAPDANRFPALRGGTSPEAEGAVKRVQRKGESVALIGPGRVGQALGRLLARAGVPIRYIVARRRAAARRAARFIGAGRAVAFESGLIGAAKVFLLTVSDDAVASVAAELARRRDDWRGTVVLHTSGSLPASVLAPLARRGARVGSLHPFQSVPTREAGARNLVGSFWSFEGDAAAARLARRWVRRLKGTLFTMRASRKTLYHAAAVVSCGGLVAQLDQSARMLARAGVPARITRLLLAQFAAETLRNFAALGARRALTGPAARGDWGTVERHRRALRRFAPDALALYDALTRHMARLAGRRQRR